MRSNSHLMFFLTLIPLSLSLSTDAFAASLARGVKSRDHSLGAALKSGAVFGVTEGMMCLLGWLAASTFADFIRAIDHWIALILLIIIGGRMIREGLSGGDDEDEGEGKPSSFFGTLITAIGTSVDSAAVGVALAVASMSAFSALMIGAFSFTASTIGFLIGPKVGEKLGGYAEIIGGGVLIGIGLMIFISHMTGNG